MNPEELKFLKRQWYQTAINDGSINLCLLVGRQLGIDPAGPGYVSDCGPKRKWSQGGVTIYVDDYGGYMTVHANGKKVCSTHYCNQLFVPGDWMEIVRAEAVQARQRKERAEAGAEQSERARLADELGINLKE